MNYKKDFLDKLFVITPFKDCNLNLIKKTIGKLSENKTNIIINHYIIYDKSCRKLLNKLSKEILFNSTNKNYNNNFVESKSIGIYASINQGLELIPQNSYYIILGAGDLFLKISGPLNIPKHKIIFFPYKLSSSRNNKFIKKMRNLMGGMPFCHNAIAYLNDGSKYNDNYRISADYEHLLEYIKRYKLNKINLQDSLQENILVEFESKNGVSSRSRISKNIENIIIIYRSFGILKIFLYFWHNSKIIINIFWKMN